MSFTDRIIGVIKPKTREEVIGAVKHHLKTIQEDLAKGAKINPQEAADSVGQALRRQYNISEAYWNKMRPRILYEIKRGILGGTMEFSRLNDLSGFALDQKKPVVLVRSYVDRMGEALGLKGGQMKQLMGTLVKYLGPTSLASHAIMHIFKVGPQFDNKPVRPKKKIPKAPVQPTPTVRPNKNNEPAQPNKSRPVKKPKVAPTANRKKPSVYAVLESRWRTYQALFKQYKINVDPTSFNKGLRFLAKRHPQFKNNKTFFAFINGKLKSSVKPGGALNALNKTLQSLGISKIPFKYYGVELLDPKANRLLRKALSSNSSKFKGKPKALVDSFITKVLEAKNGSNIDQIATKILKTK